MHTGSSRASLLGARTATLLGWAALAWFALTLLAFVVLVLLGDTPPADPDPLLAPFRWKGPEAGLA